MKTELRRIAVFCGSNFGDSDVFADAAAKLGEEIARRGIGLVYGGTNKGLMGVLADNALRHGGHVPGVITRRLSTPRTLPGDVAYRPPRMELPMACAHV